MPTFNGWTILAHPLLLNQWTKLIDTVEALKAKNPDNYQKSADAKLLAALVHLISKTVPSDPAANIYRQGSTLGDDHKHWFRAKFGNGRFRLFFRYSTRAKVIIFAWVNAETTLRTHGAKTDAYKVFKAMLNNGNPPDDWTSLHKEASNPAVIERMEKALPPTP